MIGSKVDPFEVRRLLNDWQAGSGSLFRRLATAMAELIDAGHLEGGAVLPAERKLADTLGVSRNTVIAAYQQLRDTGRAMTRRGSGTTVTRRDALSPRAARLAGTLTPNSVFDGFISPLPDAIDLRAGYWIGTDELPTDVFDLTVDPGHTAMLATAGYHPHGLFDLRDAIARRLTRQGLTTTPEQLLITTGAQQALSLLVGLLVDPGDSVLVEDSTYPGAIDVLRAYGAHVHAVHRDEHGPDAHDLRRRREQLAPRLAYLVLTGHNPTGGIAPEPVRNAIARHVDDGLVVIDDLSLADTAPGPVPPPLATYVGPSARGHVITIGSLSKAVWGGLRTGWLRAPEALIDQLIYLKTIHDIGTPATAQLLATRLLDRLDDILPARHVAITARRDHLENDLRHRMPDWRWDTPAAGLSLWIDLGPTNGVDFAAHASRYGVELAPGTISSPTGAHTHRLRIPFGQPLPVLTEGVDRIVAAWQEHASMREGRNRLRANL